MAGFNRVVLMGRLTRDPQVRNVTSGTCVADLGLATSETFKNRAGEQVETTCFVDIVAWGRQAETCGQYLSKGSPVLVEGRLQFDQWEGKDGGRRTKLRVRADRVQFLWDGRKAGARDGGPKAEAPPEAAPVTDDQDSMPF